MRFNEESSAIGFQTEFDLVLADDKIDQKFHIIGNHPKHNFKHKKLPK